MDFTAKSAEITEAMQMLFLTQRRGDAEGHADGIGLTQRRKGAKFTKPTAWLAEPKARFTKPLIFFYTIRKQKNMQTICFASLRLCVRNSI